MSAVNIFRNVHFPLIWPRDLLLQGISHSFICVKNKQTCSALSLVCTFSPMFFPPSIQHPRRFSKCSISDFQEFLKKGGGSCLFNRPTKVSSPLFIRPLVSQSHSADFPCSCLRKQNVEMDLWRWERNVTAEREQWVTAFWSREAVCCPLIQLGEARPVCLQECYKECCKKCSLANSAQCSSGPCCNTTCLVCLLASLLYKLLTCDPYLVFYCRSC